MVIKNNNESPDIILIYPPLSVSERYGRNVGNVGGQQPPLGMACLAAYLQEKGIRSILIDALAEKMTVEDIVETIAKSRPKVVGFSSLTVNFHRAIICAESVKKRFPDLLTIIGGHHATIMPKEIIQENPCFDLVCVGEGELTLFDIIEKYKEYEYKDFVRDYAVLDNIKGICYRRNKEAVLTERRELISDLDTLPFPARNLYKMERYMPLPDQYKRLPLVHLTAIRGCPFNCSFCSNNAVYGNKIRAKTPGRLLEEIKHLIKDYGAKDLSFWDDTLTANKNWMRQVCELMIKEKLDITWTCYASVKTLDRELLALMKKSGCWNIFCGFESGNQSSLDLLNKGITLEQIRTVNRWCKELDIEVRGSFMVALPGETPKLFRKTINFAKELNPDYALFCITTPYPKTKLFEEAHKYGTLDLDFSKYSIWEPVFVPFGYKNKKQILAMERKAMREFYIRPAYLLRKIKRIKSLEDFWRYLKGLRIVLGFIFGGKAE